MSFKNFFKDISSYFTLILVVLASTFILWLPFFLKLNNWFDLKIERPGMENIYRHFDGPLYVIPAKTLYDINKITPPGEGLIISLPLTEKYFAAHLPLYPLAIRLFAPIFGYLKSMLFVNVLFTILLAIFFYFFLKRLKLTNNPLPLTIVFLFLPRFLVVRTVGAPESLFMFLILLSLFFFEKKQYLLAGVLGGLSVATKTPGILLFVVYCLVFLERFIKTRQIDIRGIWVVLIPLGLLGVFGLYALQYKDFFAYFHSGDNIHLVSPFAVFNFQKAWVGTGWLEEIVLYFIIYLVTVLYLKDSKYRSFYYFALIFFIATIFVQHRDIARYSLPLWPLACVAFEKFLTSRKFLIAFIILLPAIFFYGWNFLLYNVMPIADWKPFI